MACSSEWIDGEQANCELLTLLAVLPDAALKGHGGRPVRDGTCLYRTTLGLATSLRVRRPFRDRAVGYENGVSGEDHSANDQWSFAEHSNELRRRGPDAATLSVGGAPCRQTAETHVLIAHFLVLCLKFQDDHGNAPFADFLERDVHGTGFGPFADSPAPQHLRQTPLADPDCWHSNARRRRRSQYLGARFESAKRGLLVEIQCYQAIRAREVDSGVA